MEELCKIIEELLNPKENYPNEIKVKTQEYLENIISAHQADSGFFFALMKESPNLYVRFWALSALEKIITNQYVNYDFETRAKMRNLYFDILLNYPGLVLCDAHIEHKFALIFILLVREDYPTYWPDAFTNLLSLLKIPSNDPVSPLKFQYLSIFIIYSCF